MGESAFDVLTSGFCTSSWEDIEVFLQPTPWPLVLFCGLAGLVLWGFPGAIGGTMIGLGVFWLSSAKVRERYQGSLPAGTREELSRAVLRDSRALVHRAFPNVEGPDLLNAVGQEVDAIIWRAEAIAASDRSAMSPGWALSPDSVKRAVAELQVERRDSVQRDLLAAIWSQMQVEGDWYQ